MQGCLLNRRRVRPPSNALVVQVAILSTFKVFEKHIYVEPSYQIQGDHFIRFYLSIRHNSPGSNPPLLITPTVFTNTISDTQLRNQRVCKITARHAQFALFPILPWPFWPC